MAGNKHALKNISPDEINQNPENPRTIFRPEEMENLLFSIREIGIQVPVTVYKAEDEKYYLLDGERRWRCAKKLNMETVPALVQDEPSPLDNLLMMYNIHALREQWDYYTIAHKLERIIELYKKKHDKEPTEVELNKMTGLTRGQIRRCNLLLLLPERFKEILLKELHLPKSQQKLTEDFFLEMEKSIKAVFKRMPEFENSIDDIRDTLLYKYRNGSIKAVTDFRYLTKMATSIEGLGIQKETITNALKNIFDIENSTKIEEIYQETVEFQYDEKKASRQINHLNRYIKGIIEDDKFEELDDDILNELKELQQQLTRLLGM